MLDIAAAATMGLYVNHRIKRDYKKGCGSESAAAAGMVFGRSAFRRGTEGAVGLGGMIGLSTALNSLEKQQNQRKRRQYGKHPSYVNPIEPPTRANKRPVKTGIWREHCEDGSAYGLDPENFVSADDYVDALSMAKAAAMPQPSAVSKEETEPPAATLAPQKSWRDYCSDTGNTGIDPNEYKSADDYADAVAKAKTKDEDVFSDVQSTKDVFTSGMNAENKKYRWRRYCADGSAYGIYPENYETADDYEDALKEAKREN